MVQLICSAAEGLSSFEGFQGWFMIWVAFSMFAYIVLTGLSIIAFVYWYVYPTYEKWCTKTNPRYPSPTYVAGEVFLGGVLGPLAGTFASSIHLYLISNGTFRQHCDTPLTWQHRLLSALVGVVIIDFYEWGWHYLGHWVESLWTVHKHHHKYYNPTPFGTIADWPMDNFMRSLYPIVCFAVSLTLFGQYLDIDVLYLGLGFVLQVYGMYLHCGHEFECLPYNSKIWNTSFQHYVHHAVSVKNKPFHTGFFVKLWDNLAGSVYVGTQVVPALEDQKLGNRSRERWEKEVEPNLPDYSVLLSPSWWLNNWHLAPGLSIWTM